MSQSEFWLMSPREFWNAVDGWKESEEYRQKADWERARYMAKSIVSVQVAKKDRGKLDKAFALPWDNDQQRKKKLAYQNTPEDLMRIEEEAVRAAKKLK